MNPLIRNMKLKKSLVSALVLLAGTSVLSTSAHAQRRASDYEYLDRAELRACLSNTSAVFAKFLVPFAGKLCGGQVLPYRSGRALLTMQMGDACSFKNESGQVINGTVFSCPANETEIGNMKFGGVFGNAILDSLLHPVSPITNTETNSAKVQSMLTSFLGPQQSNPEAQALVDSFVTTLLEQHPQLLLPENQAKFPMSRLRVAMTNAAKEYRSWIAKNQALQAKPAGALKDEVLKRAFAAQHDPLFLSNLDAWGKPQAYVGRGNALIIFDLTKPDTERRFYVIDLKTMVTERHLVKHGVGSGTGPFAESVSNTEDSNKSPFGFHVTGDYSWSKKMKKFKIELTGLEALNDNSHERAILIHPSSKIDETNDVVIGNTHGCAGLAPEVFARLAPMMKNGNLMLFYHRQLEVAYKEKRNQEIFKDLLRRNGFAGI